MEYKLVYSSFIDGFEREVNNALRLGWIFHGLTFVEDRVYYQAMTKQHDNRKI
jgi:hypothetical protein